MTRPSLFLVDSSQLIAWKVLYATVRRLSVFWILVLEPSALRFNDRGHIQVRLLLLVKQMYSVFENHKFVTHVKLNSSTVKRW